MAVALSFVFSSCDKSDAKKDYGFPLIYIPQATVTGLDNTYPIPNGPISQNSTYCCRYNKETSKLEIALGVVRAGYIANAKAFSVNLGEDTELTDAKLAEYSAKNENAIALPLDCCSLPEKISVEAGKNSGTCYLGLDLKALAKLPLFDTVSKKYKLLVLGLKISNPTEYELAETNTRVAIVLDFNSKYWDEVAENAPESIIRDLFPKY